ncbi:hypothetical protein B0T10DRAFT_220742 [Thelonectria olida]|uniref:Uncharacterized protein n=1 Tax=Thelonectria olida TaxID=1576542 RepID=A0A9P9AQV6_9HYPO|nr:hypothetical protein B0T10DRAFT_220742 [Thelonectria olida]
MGGMNCDFCDRQIPTSVRNEMPTRQRFNSFHCATPPFFGFAFSLLATCLSNVTAQLASSTVAPPITTQCPRGDAETPWFHSEGAELRCLASFLACGAWSPNDAIWSKKARAEKSARAELRQGKTVHIEAAGFFRERDGRFWGRLCFLGEVTRNIQACLVDSLRENAQADVQLRVLETCLHDRANCRGLPFVSLFAGRECSW